ncbi:MAG: hypothetical protein QXN75_00610 [Thermoproteota archaeon]
MRRSSSVGFAILEAFFENTRTARIIYLSMKPDESFKAKGLKAFSELEGNRIVFKVACGRGVRSLAYTLYEYLQHLKTVEDAVSILEKAKYPCKPGSRASKPSSPRQASLQS